MIVIEPGEPSYGREKPYLLISYEWHSEVVGDLRDDLREFAKEARAYDAEAGFTALRGLERTPGPAGGPNRHLVVRMVDDQDGESSLGPIVALLSIIEVDELGVGTALLVVGPEYRSRGISTLLVEKLAAEDAGEGWFSTGLTGIRAIADGAHPAAGRLAARFGFQMVDETWLLLRMIRGQQVLAATRAGVEVTESRSPAKIEAGVPVVTTEAEADRVLVECTYTTGDPGVLLAWTHAVGKADAKPDQLATMRFSHGISTLTDEQIDGLLRPALDDIAAAGAEAVLAGVDPRHLAVVRACRRNYFQHDQSNLVYAVPVPD